MPVVQNFMPSWLAQDEKHCSDFIADLFIAHFDGDEFHIAYTEMLDE
jgi:hypothetical protein